MKHYFQWLSPRSLRQVQERALDDAYFELEHQLQIGEGVHARIEALSARIERLKHELEAKS